MMLLCAGNGRPVSSSVRMVITLLALTSGGEWLSSAPRCGHVASPPILFCTETWAIGHVRARGCLTGGSLLYYGVDGSPRGVVRPIPQGSGEAEPSREVRARQRPPARVGRSRVLSQAGRGPFSLAWVIPGWLDRPLADRPWAGLIELYQLCV